MAGEFGALVPWAGPGFALVQCWLACGESAGGSVDVCGAVVGGGNEDVHGEKSCDADEMGLTCSNLTHLGNHGALKVFVEDDGSGDVKASYAVAAAVAVVFDDHLHFRLHQKSSQWSLRVHDCLF